jgi:hypothetical protein
MISQHWMHLFFLPPSIGRNSLPTSQRVVGEEAAAFRGGLLHLHPRRRTPAKCGGIIPPQLVRYDEVTIPARVPKADTITVSVAPLSSYSNPTAARMFPVKACRKSQAR